MHFVENSNKNVCLRLFHLLTTGGGMRVKDVRDDVPVLPHPMRRWGKEAGEEMEEKNLHKESHYGFKSLPIGISG